MHPRIRHHSFRSVDGLRIDYQTVGPKDVPTIVLVNGPGANIYAWREVVDAFAPRFRIVAWDYRGFFRSERPLDPGALGPSDHLRDLERLIEVAEVEHAVFVSWSLGTQIQRELYRRRPELFRAFVAVNGSCGHPFDGPGDDAPRTRFQQALTLTRRGVTIGGVDALARNPLLLSVAKRLGIVSPVLAHERFLEIAAGFADQDVEAFASMVRELTAHDATDVLEDIVCPTLFVAEGLLMYLEPDDVQALLTTLARRRPGSEIVLEGISSFLLRGRFGQRSATLRDTGAIFKWGLSRPEALCQMVPGAEILFVGHHAEVYPKRWRWLRLTRPIRPLRQAMRVVHLRLPGAPS